MTEAMLFELQPDDPGIQPGHVMPDGLKEAIRDVIEVPCHIAEAARACESEILNGPRYAALPACGRWTAFTDDDWSSAPSRLGRPTTKVCWGPVGDMLRRFISELPTLYSDEDEEFVSTEISRPGEHDDTDADPETCCELDDEDTVEALFGRTIAKEFR